MANKRGDSAESSEVKPRIIIEKYLMKKPDLEGSIKTVLLTLFKGEVHTFEEWDEIIKRRLERPAV